MFATTDRRVFTGLMALLIGAAWLALWVWGQSPYGRYLGHDPAAGGDILGGLGVLLFAGGWTLMTVAMMLPTSLPLIARFRAMTSARPDGVRLVLLLMAGYLAIWSLFGLAVHAGDRVLHAIVEQIAWLDANAWLIGAGTLAVAGLYQLTPLKYHCLTKCRSPLSFIVEHWRGRHERSQAFALGVHHGIFCVGCCWSLMLLMFAVGVGSLGWMLGLGALMAIEKNLPWGRRISEPLGVALMGWSAVVVLAAAGLRP